VIGKLIINIMEIRSHFRGGRFPYENLENNESNKDFKSIFVLPLGSWCLVVWADNIEKIQIDVEKIANRTEEEKE
jgi:hypothetical protein